ncbi:synaptic vesicle glycoprotein 2B-like [Anoplophora glabripennis]|uniref:synaptic vesicle glycoprotein 2B-like n=1 Tax=Anoplophora glabripennis TaxID=217634 RepID=UPI000875754B|nr:synaptic vesicle glycoprotein 2B-like [Anoplophora glabripennis]
MDEISIDVISDNKNNTKRVNSISQKNGKLEDLEEADFETAISATGFGKFNIILILVILPTVFAQVFESTSMSFVLPIAQCDLNLRLQDKGILNAITFAGMISSGFAWGYICDVAGRKKVMIIGYFLDGFFALMASSSQNFVMLLIAKFFGGFIINGPFSAATSYVSEFHCSKYRTRVHLVRGTIVSLGNIAVPLISWAVLPQNLNFKLFDYFEFQSWNVFLLILSLSPITSGIAFLFMPESPKFLMSTGRNAEALRVFQKIYRINKGKSADTYPIKVLANEMVLDRNDKNSVEQKGKKAIIEGLYKIKPLFCPPLLFKLLLVCMNSFIILMSTNTLKLWLPQLFQAINDYEFDHNGASSSMCEMLDSGLKLTNSTSSTCAVNLDNSSVYIRSIIVGFTSILCFSLTGTIINALGKKKLIIAMTLIAGTSASCLYLSPNSETVLALSTIFLALAGVCANVLVTITLEIFPTNLRAMALSLHFMFARTGSIVGNVVFPYLLQTGCAPPFFYIGFLTFGCTLLTMVYPNTENKPLK